MAAGCTSLLWSQPRTCTHEHTQVHMHTCTHRTKFRAPTYSLALPKRVQAKPARPASSSLTPSSPHTSQGGQMSGGSKGGRKQLRAASRTGGRKQSPRECIRQVAEGPHLLGHLLGAKRRPLTPQPRPSPAQTLTHTHPHTDADTNTRT